MKRFQQENCTFAIDTNHPLALLWKEFFGWRIMKMISAFLDDLNCSEAKNKHLKEK